MDYPTTMFVRPAQGLKIRDLESGHYLPETGQSVPRTPFWLRRLKDGDVIEGTESVGAVNAKTEA